MAGRRLDPEERALWARVAATVVPLGKKAALPLPSLPGDGRGPEPSGDGLAVPGPGLRRGGAKGGEAAKISAHIPSSPRKSASQDTLDASWDRRLRRGLVAPERSIDLHGHTLATAHAALETALIRAVADDVRLLLVVTGRPPREGDTRRRLIRSQIGDWLAGSGQRDRIAAIRHAHPRHGGAGALYLILRRRRG